jgi:hypothetical protein
MAPEDRVDVGNLPSRNFFRQTNSIPGLDPSYDDDDRKKIPYSKPIPKSFQVNHQIDFIFKSER